MGWALGVNRSSKVEPELGRAGHEGARCVSGELGLSDEELGGCDGEVVCQTF